MYSQIIILGNLTKDPETRFTPSGTQVTSLNVAANRTYTGSDGQKVKEVTYFRVSVWGKGAESAAQYLKKGQGVLVEGRLTPDASTGNPRTYQKQDGTTGASYEVFANTVRFLPSGQRQEQSVESSEEEIPF